MTETSTDITKPGLVPADQPAPDGQAFEGEPNRLPPALPGKAHEPAPDVIALEEWYHAHVHNSHHSRDTDHLNRLFRMKEALRLELFSKQPSEG